MRGISTHAKINAIIDTKVLFYNVSWHNLFLQSQRESNEQMYTILQDEITMNNYFLLE